MLELPSFWNLMVSTIVFFISLWYIRHTFDAQEIPQGMVRSLLMFVLASLVSCGSGEAVDWVQGKINGPQTKVEISPAQLTEHAKGIT